MLFDFQEYSFYRVVRRSVMLKNLEQFMGLIYWEYIVKYF